MGTGTQAVASLETTTRVNTTTASHTAPTQPSVPPTTSFALVEVPKGQVTNFSSDYNYAGDFPTDIKFSCRPNPDAHPYAGKTKRTLYEMTYDPSTSTLRLGVFYLNTPTADREQICEPLTMPFCEDGKFDSNACESASKLFGAFVKCSQQQVFTSCE